MTPKKKHDGFVSLRILGKKAQDLIRVAKKRVDKEREQDDKRAAADIPVEEPQEPTVRMSFSTGSVAQATLVILGIIVGAWMMFILRDKLIMLLLAFFVASIIDPSVAALEHRKVPRSLAILFHYFIAVFLFIFLLVSLIPILAQQLEEIATLISAQVNAFINNPTIALPLVSPEMNQNLTDFVRGILENLSINEFTDALKSLSESLGSISVGSFKFIADIGLTVVGFLVRLIIVFVLAFFIQMEKEQIRMWFRSFFPARMRRYLDTKTDAVHVKMGKWARGQLILSLCIGLLVLIALLILGIPYAVTLAVLAAFTEFIPYIGPFIAAVPAILIALTQGGIVWALVVAVIYYVIQWCENNLLVPLIMKRAVGLSPIAIIFAMLVGVSFPTVIHPILGILLAIPVTTISVLFLEDWREMRKGRHE